MLLFFPFLFICQFAFFSLMNTETKFVLHIDLLLETDGPTFKIFDRRKDAEHALCQLIRNSSTFAGDWASIRQDEDWSFSRSKEQDNDEEDEACPPSQVTLEFLKLHPYLASDSLQVSCAGQEQQLLDMFRRVKATTQDAEITDEDVMLFVQLERDNCGMKIVEAPYFPFLETSPGQKKRK